MKQVLTITDLSVINSLVNREIASVERYASERISKDCFKMEKVPLKEKELKLKKDSYYQDLVHLKNSLRNICVEVETASVEIDDSGIVEDVVNLLGRK